MFGYQSQLFGVLLTERSVMELLLYISFLVPLLGEVFTLCGVTLPMDHISNALTGFWQLITEIIFAASSAGNRTQVISMLSGHNNCNASDSRPSCFLLLYTCYDLWPDAMYVIAYYLHMTWAKSWQGNIYLYLCIMNFNLIPVMSQSIYWQCATDTT